MQKYLRLGILLTALVLAGCGARAPVPPALVDDTTVRLGSDGALNLEKLLTEDRATLAKLAEETAGHARDLRSTLGTKPKELLLLPSYVISSGRGLLHQPRYSEKLGVSVPSYHKEGQPDPELALHLARHGDAEAARMLAPPGDVEFAKQIDAVRPTTNYPAEWVQLVAQAQHLAELKVTAGMVDGATDLASLHRQLNAVLDDRAKAGPLGALLLPTGRRTLTDAAAAWRKPGHIKSALADDIDAVVKNWGHVPDPQPLLTPGAPREAVTRVLGNAGGARGIATQEDAVARAVDLLALPVVPEGVEGVVAFLDSKGQLGEFQVNYVARINQRYPEPHTLALPLVERGATGPEALRAAGLTFTVTLLPRSNALGAVVRIADARAEPLAATLPAQPLEFAPLRLDRSFETNRLLLDRQKPFEARGRLAVERADTIKSLQQPVREPLPGEVILEREKEYDLVRALQFRWKPGQIVAVEAASKLAGPLWAAYGPAKFEQSDSDADALYLRWEQAGVVYALRLPTLDTESPTFAVTRTDHSPATLTARDAAARKLDQQDRAARLAERKPVERLERWLQVAGLKLGLSKEDALKLLPKTDAWRQVKTPDSVVLYHSAPPPAKVTFWPRMLVVRFDSKDRVTEVRGLYTEGPARPDARTPGLFETFQAHNGEPAKVAATWGGLWANLPPLGGAAQAFRWQDDVTSLRFQRDAFAAELTLTDRPADAPEGGTLAPLVTVGQGVPGCTLGASKADVLKQWPNPPATPDGGLALNQPAESKFDAVIVYFTDDKVSRVLARLAEKPSGGLAGVEAILGKFYSENPTLGLVRRRQTERAGDTLAGWGWHDDAVRVWAFGEETREGPRVFVEWRGWPVK